MNRWGLRVDHRFSSKDTIWVSLNYSKGSPYFVAQGYAPKLWLLGGRRLQHPERQLHLRAHFLARRSQRSRFGYLRHASVRQGMNKDFNPAQSVPATLSRGVWRLPYMRIGNHVAIGDYGGSDRAPQMTPQYIDNMTLGPREAHH